MYPPLLVDYQQYFQEYTTNTKRVRRIKTHTDFLNCCHTQTIHELKSNLNAKYFTPTHYRENKEHWKHWKKGRKFAWISTFALDHEKSNENGFVCLPKINQSVHNFRCERDKKLVSMLLVHVSMYFMSMFYQCLMLLLLLLVLLYHWLLLPLCFYSCCYL